MHPYLSLPGPRAFAHRGWHLDDMAGLENSLAAFHRAVDEGYTYLETDVHTTSDDVVVVSHDETLDRTTDRTGVIGDLPWSEVRKARIGGTEPVRVLEEVFEDLPHTRFNIDVKCDAAVAPVIRAIRRTGAIDRVALASFSSQRLARLRGLGGPDLAVAMSPRSIAMTFLGSRLAPLPLGGLVDGAMAQVPAVRGRIRLVDRAFVRAAHRVGAEVHVWTIDEPDRMHELLDQGVDGIMTDRPDVLRAVLRERGQWPGSGATGEPSPATQPAAP